LLIKTIAMPRKTRTSKLRQQRNVNARYGWIPDRPDQRDLLYSAPPVHLLKELPAKVDLRAQCPPVYDQGQLGSCTANAIAGAIQFDQMVERLREVFLPSRLFIYYNERAIEGTVSSDSGAMIRDGMKSVAKQGVCPESMWPYNIGKFRIKPSQGCYSAAANHTAVNYLRLVPILQQLKGCLASGYPFVFGFTVYESFESATVARTGKAPMPASNERVLGGHAVCAVGYNDAQRMFLCRNSWGVRWGMKGYFTLPYGYLTDRDLAADFWTIRVVQ
jgi:C1A family cysteine protease